MLSYNAYAFGSIAGPYDEKAIEFSAKSLTTLIGLFIDQDHGFLFQNPILFFALPGIATLFARSWRLGLIWTLVFLALIVPNGLHPGWYGLYSLAGRFSVSAAMVAFVPTLSALASLGRYNRRVLIIIALASLVLQAWIYYHATWIWQSTYPHNRSMSPGPPQFYSIFYPALANWLPILENPAPALRWGPNAAWLFSVGIGVLAGIVAASLSSVRRRVVALASALVICTVAVTAAGATNRPPTAIVKYDIAALPSLTGRVQQGQLVAEPGRDKLGYVNFGPYQLLPPGFYRVTLRYSSPAPASEPVLHFDISDADAGVRHEVAALMLNGTAGHSKDVSVIFRFAAYNRHRFQFRTNWLGTQELRVEALKLEIL